MITLKHEQRPSISPAKPKNPFLARVVLTSALAVGCTDSQIAEGIFNGVVFGPWAIAACVAILSKDNDPSRYEGSKVPPELASDRDCFKKRNLLLRKE